MLINLVEEESFGEILKDIILDVCKTRLSFAKKLTVEGLIGIRLDDNQTMLVNLPRSALLLQTNTPASSIEGQHRNCDTEKAEAILLYPQDMSSIPNLDFEINQEVRPVSVYCNRDVASAQTDSEPYFPSYSTHTSSGMHTRNGDNNDGAKDHIAASAKTNSNDHDYVLPTSKHSKYPDSQCSTQDSENSVQETFISTINNIEEPEEQLTEKETKPNERHKCIIRRELHDSPVATMGEECKVAAFQCNRCGIMFSDRKQVTSHLETDCEKRTKESFSEQFVEVDQIYPSLSEVQLSTFQTIKCHKCEQEFVSPKKFQCHLSNVHQNTTFVCHFCYMEYNNRQSLRTHISQCFQKPSSKFFSRRQISKTIPCKRKLASLQIPKAEHSMLENAPEKSMQESLPRQSSRKRKHTTKMAESDLSLGRRLSASYSRQVPESPDKLQHEDYMDNVKPSYSMPPLKQSIILNINTDQQTQLCPLCQHKFQTESGLKDHVIRVHFSNKQ